MTGLGKNHHHLILPVYLLHVLATDNMIVVCWAVQERQQRGQRLLVLILLYAIGLTAGGDRDPSNSMRRHHVEDLQKTVGRAAATLNRWDLQQQPPLPNPCARGSDAAARSPTSRLC